jgi:hypothetical protein
MFTTPLAQYRQIPSLYVDYLIHRLLPRPGRVLLIGPAKVGKSFLALQIALAVAQGKDFLGRRSHQGTVLYLQFDTPDHLWKERLDDLEECGVDLSGPIHFIHPDAKRPSMDILNSGCQADITAMLAEVKPALVVIDVLRKIHNADENDSATSKKIFDVLNILFAGRTLLILHHPSKMKPDWTPRASEAGRGSGFIGGEVDASWLLLPESLSIESRIDEGFTRTITRDPNTGLWMFPDAMDTAAQDAGLIALCEEFPQAAHSTLADTAKARFQISRASYYRRMKGLQCRHSETPLGESATHPATASSLPPPTTP